MTETVAKSLVVAQDLQTTDQLVAGSKRTFIKLYPATGGGNISIPVNGTTTVQFELPTKSINYPLSRLCGNNNLPTTGGAHVRNFYVADSPAFIGAASFKARTGGTFFDIDFLPNYCKMVNRFDKDMNEVMSNDAGDVIKSIRALDHMFRNTGATTKPNHQGVEAQYATMGEKNSALDQNFQFSLADVAPNTIFSKKHDIKLPEITILTLRLGPANRYAWRAGADTQDNPYTSPAVLANAVTLSDFHIMLCVNDDEKMEALIDAEMARGKKYVLNTVVCSQNAHPAASGNHNVTVTYNSGHGKRIKKIYHSVFNNTDVQNTTLDNDCVAVRKVEDYQVKLNDRSTSDDRLSTDPTKPTAYLYHKHLLKGTTVTNDNIYRANFVHIEDLGRLGSPYDQNLLGIRPENVVAGVNLDQDFKFTFSAKTQSQPYIHYTFAVVQRDLYVTSNSILIQ